ncbi:MAG: hypothetical protein LBR23_00605, partial [Spirochaetaceae bacterium]|nr:hypothetical protein [Spirochaetaceae bacterium]
WDKARKEDIRNAVSDISIFEIWEAEKESGKKLGIEDIHQQIDDVVSLIKAKIVTLRRETGDPLIWDDDESHRKKLAKICERGVLSVDDDITFNSTVDTMNGLFGKNYKEGFVHFGKCTFFFGGKRFVWFPRMDTKLESNWHNTFGPNRDTLLSEYQGEGIWPTDPKVNNPDIERAIFAREQNALGEYAYRFAGVYRETKYTGKNSVCTRTARSLCLADWR